MREIIPAWRVKRVIERYIVEVNKLPNQKAWWDKVFQQELGISVGEAWAILGREPDQGPQRRGD
jgi:hypothetical protein